MALMNHETCTFPNIDNLNSGKLHLTKDHVATPEQFRRLYPRYRELLQYKRELDPGALFTSDLARRVGMV